MTGKEKIAEMLEDGTFADVIATNASCPDAFGLKQGDLCIVNCKACWRKALESEVGE